MVLLEGDQVVRCARQEGAQQGRSAQLQGVEEVARGTLEEAR